MMYKEGFVVAVKNDRGQVLRESRDREVFLPFSSNYSLLLKNNNNRRALAEITIDGTNVLGSQRMIIPAYGSVDVERFCIDGNLSEGRKFEFVRASDGRVQDPTSGENGYVTVKFWLEKEFKMPDWVYSKPRPVTPVKPWRPPYDPQPPFTWGGGTADFSSMPIGGTTCGSTKTYGSQSAEPQSIMYACCNQPEVSSRGMEEKGATVEGGWSNQSFSEGYIGEVEDTYVEITIKLKPSKEAVTVKQTRKLYCSNCGEKVKHADKFCSKCGNRL